MSKRTSRPWEHRGVGGTSSESHAPSALPAGSSEPVPGLLVDGVTYFSDRFYLNRGVGDPPAVGSATDGCTCGARSPPPLLDRERLVASLELKAAIVASYTLAPSHMIRAYPSLFGPDSTVPTLVLHGHKGFSDRSKKRQSNKAPSMSQQSDSQSSGRDSEADGWNDSCYQQDTKRARIDDVKREGNNKCGVLFIESSSDDDDEDDGPWSRQQVKLEYGDDEDQVTAIKEEEPPEDAWLRKQNATIDPTTARFGKHVHLTEILTTWLPDDAKDTIEVMRKEQVTKVKHDDDVIVLDSDDEKTPADASFGVESFVTKRRLHKQGVHHPKFMILFETSGSVVVLVTTANLNPQHSVDASWVQRFEPLPIGDRDIVTDTTRCDGSDFGLVLANFLECQSLAARAGEMMPEVFLRRYLGNDALDDFHQRYRWNAQVHLVATVPGEYSGSKTATHLGTRGTKRTFLYGSQRVNDILCRLSKSQSDRAGVSPALQWLPQDFLSDEDRLIFQPTSFGGHWNQTSFCSLVMLYFDYGSNASVTSHGRANHLLQQTDIVWPTRAYMTDINKRGNKCNARVPSPDSVATIKTERTSTISNDTDSSFLFLSSISFNTIDFACISRMCMFEPSYPSQAPSNRAPHIKSFARMFEGDDYQLRKRFRLEKAEEYLSWFLLTSACLSRGAQGEAAPRRAFDSDEMTYSNFELGVLFVSRLQGDKRSDRLYCSRPSRCRCSQAHPHEKNMARMIHLPLPYRLRPQRYHADDEETEMCSTPYFHEIPHGTGFVGQMRLTPLGMELAASQL